MTPPSPPPLIALLTDFGLAGAYAGVLHGVVAGIAPHTRVIDLCHEVPPQDVRAGAFLLLTSYRFFPPGTIFGAVVDPGVGTNRAIVVVRAGGHTFAGPDNGLLRWAVEDAGPVQEAVRVEQPRYRLSRVSNTFHGRDVIAPAVAHLSLGVPLSALGPPAPPLAGDPFPRPAASGATLSGEVLYVDRFGNAITNLSPLPGVVRIQGRELRRVRTYAEGRPGEPVALEGSSGFLEVAVGGGSAAADLGVTPGTTAILTTATLTPPAEP
ncbi:MAG TPA: SAM-dependent chlorinase/fluorinase [Chloroflexota bacterium]|nr:SAM-dependent chlorinase/fluorinase [Chloroflexota bacterium]